MPRFEPTVIASDMLYDMRIETTLEETRLAREYDDLFQSYMVSRNDNILTEMDKNVKRRKRLDNKRVKIALELCRRNIHEITH